MLKVCECAMLLLSFLQGGHFTRLICFCPSSTQFNWFKDPKKIPHMPVYYSICMVTVTYVLLVYITVSKLCWFHLLNSVFWFFKVKLEYDQLRETLNIVTQKRDLAVKEKIHLQAKLENLEQVLTVRKPFIMLQHTWYTFIGTVDPNSYGIFSWAILTF